MTHQQERFATTAEVGTLNLDRTDHAGDGDGGQGA